MTYLLGRGRYASQTYPRSSVGNGSTATVVPLSRQKFIDGDTTQTGNNGSVASPFSTIAAFMASRPNASVNDATANYVGWTMPALAGYVENVAFPPYTATELRADSVSALKGTAVTGNVTWANVAGAHAGTQALAVMHNISVSGTFTVTDDAGAPVSTVIFSGDEIANSAVTLGGQFVATGATHLAAVEFYNAVAAGGINLGTASNSAALILANSSIVGAVACKSLAAFNTSFNSPTIAIAAASTAAFFDCHFTAATQLTALSGARFDGASWISFLRAGGTRAAGTIVVVEGGASAGLVSGANLPTTGVNTNVSIDGTGASVGYTGSNSGNHYTSSGLAADGASVTIKTGGEEADGDTVLITKTDLAAHALAVKNNAGTTIGTIPSGSRGFVLAQYSAASGDFVFAEGGSLVA